MAKYSLTDESIVQFPFALQNLYPTGLYRWQIIQ